MNIPTTEMQEVFEKLGLNAKQIKQANAVHKLVVKQEQQKGGGAAAAVPTEAEIQKMFDFDDKTMANLKKAHEAAVKQNQLALRKTQKLRGGGEGFKILSTVGMVTVGKYLGIASGNWIPYIAFNVGWPIISSALNNFIDGAALENKQFDYICKLMAYVLPIGMIQYFVTKVLLDSYGFQATTAGGGMSGGVFFDIPGIDLVGFTSFFGEQTGVAFDFFKSQTGLTAVFFQIFTKIIQPVFSTLISFSLKAGTVVVGAASSDIVLTAVAVGFIGKYMYTRFYGNKDQNKDLDKTLYTNWKRRRMIIKAYENRKAREKRELEDRQERYKEKEEKLLDLLEKGEEPEPDEPKEEKKTEEEVVVRKNPVWYGYKITDDDRDEYYQKSFKKSMKKRLANSNKAESAKKDEDEQEDAEFLKKAEETLENK